MVRLYSAANLPDAQILLDLLKAKGIPARIFNENAQGGLGEIPFTHTYPEIWLVDDRDVVRAQEVVTEFERSAEAEGTRRCPGCGEENPKNFQICWHCNRSL